MHLDYLGALNQTRFRVKMVYPYRSIARVRVQGYGSSYRVIRNHLVSRRLHDYQVCGDLTSRANRCRHDVFLCFVEGLGTSLIADGRNNVTDVGSSILRWALGGCLRAVSREVIYSENGSVSGSVCSSNGLLFVVTTLFVAGLTCSESLLCCRCA